MVCFTLVNIAKNDELHKQIEHHFNAILSANQQVRI